MGQHAADILMASVQRGPENLEAARANLRFILSQQLLTNLTIVVQA
jgi:hypothetical protein